MSRRRACSTCRIRHNALCGALTRELLPQLSRIAHLRRYAAGQFIAGPDRQQAWVASILSGVVKLTRTMADGRQQIVGLLFPADFVGRPFANTSPYRVEAATPVELCCIDRTCFEDLLARCAGLRQRLLERTLNEMDALREWMLVLGCKSAEERVASLILLMATRLRAAAASETQDSDGVCYDLPLSRTEMAECLGLRAETVSRQLKQLDAAGIIESENGRCIRVPDLDKLKLTAGSDFA